MFDTICGELNDIAVEKGFWPENVDDIFITKQLMMIVSEAVEVMEAIRKDKGERAIADEMADILIRTLDLYAGLARNGYLNISLDYAFEEKVKFNKERPQLHGGKF